MPERYQCFKQIMARTVLAARLALSCVIISAALEKILSAGALVAGIAK